MTGALADSMQNPVAPATAIWFLVIMCAVCFLFGVISDRRRGR